MLAGVGSSIRKSALWAYKNQESRGGISYTADTDSYDGIVTALTSQLGKSLHYGEACQPAMPVSQPAPSSSIEYPRSAYQSAQIIQKSRQTYR